MEREPEGSPAGPAVRGKGLHFIESHFRKRVLRSDLCSERVTMAVVWGISYREGRVVK